MQETCQDDFSFEAYEKALSEMTSVSDDRFVEEALIEFRKHIDHCIFCTELETSVIKMEGRHLMDVMGISWNCPKYTKH